MTQDFITSTQLLSSTSWRPLHDLALCNEAVRVGQMLYCLKQQRATIYECKTDSCLYRPLKRRKKNVLRELSYRDLSTLRDEFELSNGSKRLNGFSSLPPVPSEEKPFRVLRASEKDLLKCNPRLPKRTGTVSIPGQMWKELQPEEATTRVELQRFEYT